MKKFNLILVAGFVFCAFSVTAQNTPSSDTTSKTPVQEEEYNIMKRDQIDNTNTLAIPFDDSEVEDEEEIDRLEGKNTFDLPHSK